MKMIDLVLEAERMGKMKEKLLKECIEAKGLKINISKTKSDVVLLRR